jgi:hypothetical protein
VSELTTLLHNIGNTSWFFYGLSLLMFYYLTKGQTDKSSALVTLIVIMVFNSLMQGYQGIMDWYIKENPGFSSTVNFFWYMGFAGIDLIAMKAIYKVHEKENVRISPLGQYASFAFFVSANIQLLQYAEIVIFKTDEYIDKLYRFGIPAINIGTAIICFGVALMALYHFYFTKEGQKG